MIAKKHEHGISTILAVCDKEHLGKEFEEGKIYFHAKESFYGGKEIDEKELKKAMRESDSLNLFGNKCVEIAQKEGLISESSLIIINGIKHAQVYKI